MTTIQDIFELPLNELMQRASDLRDIGFAHNITYSRKVFIPLTRLCRDVCHYCTYATTPKNLTSPYMSLDEVIEVAKAGAEANCKEALFTLGDKPERRYPVARKALESMGYATTIEYVEAAAKTVLKETGLLPHLNPGILSPEDYARLRPVSASMGLMLESGSRRLCEKGGPHYGSPDKHPYLRFNAIRAAGKANVPFTTGLLIGIGETREERIDDLLSLKKLHDEYGHIQDLILQPFRPKPRTKMANHPEAPEEELLWSIAAARLIFGAEMSIQAPPNLLAPESLGRLIDAGINDWGGVSPVTPDHVNPEAPWPHLEALERETNRGGKNLEERLAITPGYAKSSEKWLDPSIAANVRRKSDGDGFARTNTWYAGLTERPPHVFTSSVRDPALTNLIYEAAEEGSLLDEAAITRLFKARGGDVMAIAEAANAVRKKQVGDAVSYVVNRNINYTNICLYSCEFCAFSKGRGRESLRGAPYGLDLDNVALKVREAIANGATEVCMQGGIHPKFTGQTYSEILKAVRGASETIHIHAFSPLEISHGAESSGVSIREFLTTLKSQGLDSLPGTAAEILHDDVRKTLCADKVNSEEWLDIMQTAHEIGLRSTATIMFGHIDDYSHWARHLSVIRELQAKTSGFTEFVPLPFVHMQAPIAMQGRARSGPTWRESVLMHAVSRLVFKGFINNIQASWVKLGMQGATQMLAYGANDLGGVLMNESITSSAGASHGQRQDEKTLKAAIQSVGKTPRRRSTLYAPATEVDVYANATRDRSLSVVV